MPAAFCFSDRHLARVPRLLTCVCTSTDPRDHGIRPSSTSSTVLREDSLTPARPRQQARTRCHRTTPYVHARHADHCGTGRGTALQCHKGDDSLLRERLPWETLRQTFHYIFDGVPRLGGGIPQLEVHEIAGPLSVQRVRVLPVPVWHGQMPVLGFRFGDFAYLTDCNRLADEAWELLEDVDTLVIDAIANKPHVSISISPRMDVVAG